MIYTYEMPEIPEREHIAPLLKNAVSRHYRVFETEFSVNTDYVLYVDGHRIPVTEPEFRAWCDGYFYGRLEEAMD